jgi:hypothetical protein
MSLPGVPPIPLPTTQNTMNPFDSFMTSINTNPYLIGIMMVSLNIGGRFLGLEISREQEKFLSQPWVRRFFLFAILFVATRNIIIAVGLSILVILVISFLLNENSSLCLWKSCGIPKTVAEAAAEPGLTNMVGLTPDEQQLFRRLQDKLAFAKQAEKGDSDSDSEEEPKQKKILENYFGQMNGFLSSSYSKP